MTVTDGTVGGNHGCVSNYFEHCHGGHAFVRPRRRLTRRIRAETHGASRESPPRLTAETHGVSRAVSRRLTRRESATTTRRVIIHCDTLLSGCYRCFDHHSIQVHSTTLCHDCPMIVACCTNACHCVAAAVAIIK